MVAVNRSLFVASEKNSLRGSERGGLGGSEFGGAYVHHSCRGEEKEGGRVPCIPESQVTNRKTGKGGKETDRWKTSGVERWRDKNTYKAVCSNVVKPNSLLMLRTHSPSSQVTACVVCTQRVTLLILPVYFSFTSHRNPLAHAQKYKPR